MSNEQRKPIIGDIWSGPEGGKSFIFNGTHWIEIKNDKRTIQEIKTNKEALEKFLQQTICQFEEANEVHITEFNWQEYGEKYNAETFLERNLISITIVI